MVTVDTGVHAAMLMRVFLGWLRGERGHCGMVAIPTMEGPDATALLRLIERWRKPGVAVEENIRHGRESDANPVIATFRRSVFLPGSCMTRHT
jgi:hypothetical protein